jgi:cysteine synthase A
MLANKEIFDYILSNDFCQAIFFILLFSYTTILFYKYIIDVDKGKKGENILDNSKTQIFELMKKTPVIYIKSLSNLTGHNIYAKCEYFSYYSSKDRVIKRILLTAQKKGIINKNTNIFENSTGLSGYSVASISQLLGYNSTIVIPDSCPSILVSQIKRTNCNLIKTKKADFSNFSDNYIRKCKKLSEENENSFYINLYQNELNYITHFEETGPELFNQLNKKVDAFVCCMDTGGTLSGISNFLKIKNEKCLIGLVDIDGSGFYSYIKEGVLFRQEIKDNKKNKEYDYIDDISKDNCFLNNNLRNANIDDCYLTNYNEVMFLIDYLKKNDGINIGIKEGINLVGILKMIKDKKHILSKNSNIATIFFGNGLYDSEIISKYNRENNPIKNIEQIFNLN